MSRIDDLLVEEGAAAEAYQNAGQLPEHVTVDRPNRGRPAVVSVRLAAEEHARLQRAASEANLPLSTIIRLWALDRLRAQEQDDNIAERLTRLEQAVFQRPARPPSDGVSGT